MIIARAKGRFRITESNGWRRQCQIRLLADVIATNRSLPLRACDAILARIRNVRIRNRTLMWDQRIRNKGVSNGYILQ